MYSIECVIEKPKTNFIREDGTEITCNTPKRKNPRYKLLEEIPKERAEYLISDGRSIICQRTPMKKRR